MAHSQNTASFKEANKKYVENFPEAQGALTSPPLKRIAVVTCMDCRLDPFAHLGLLPGEAHVIRTAGGTAEALRSLIISQRVLGTNEIAVFHHNDCGMTEYDTFRLRTQIWNEAPKDPDGNISVEVSTALEAINFKPMGRLDGSVKADVKFLREHPLILYGESITGWEYDVKTGEITLVNVDDD
ncbi:carbonic anhydrase [Athelia psychrophila]|uniref:Carbonic anhydrase n=1 Tax=Athelia psychrophila TaxID=1759441 RepID=A0A166R7S8_9AGAM|nr:carbonic anhydrase [Fibularhizoctonia sp. CBS 109695]